MSTRASWSSSAAKPNLTELGLFSVMWSEHCSYKSSRVHLKTLPTEGPRVVQGPRDAGRFDIGDGLVAVFQDRIAQTTVLIEPIRARRPGVAASFATSFTMAPRPIALSTALRFGTMDDADRAPRC